MMPEVNSFIEKVKSGEPIEFQDTIAVIAGHYRYSPARFTNGLGEDAVINGPGSNEGSCKIFSFAQSNGLSEPQTLALFGRYYRDDVLGHPDGQDHKNIRNFMKYGWAGIHFEGEVLHAL